MFVDDQELCDFFSNLLSDQRVIEDGKVICENKGVMAGMPAAVFLAILGLIRHLMPCLMFYIVVIQMI